MERANTLNVVVTGQLRCGAAVIQTSLQSCTAMGCHPELLHPDETIRRRLHEEYFGPSPDGMKLHFEPLELSAEQYLNERVFDHPQEGEEVIGVKLPYPHIEQWRLWEYLFDRCRDGDFAVIHVTRNPLACYVSLKQAEVSGFWYQTTTRFDGDIPDPIDINAKEFTQFCREHLAHEAKLRQMVDDRLEIEYKELFLNYHEVMRGVFDYLEVPPQPSVSPGVRRMRNRSIKDRVLNFQTARQQVPADVRMYFDSNDLF